MVEFRIDCSGPLGYLVTVEIWRDNPVLDRDLNVAYLDSFGVFFYPDVVHAVDGIDEEIEQRMQLSRRRLEYIESLI